MLHFANEYVLLKEIYLIINIYLAQIPTVMFAANTILSSFTRHAITQ